MGPGEWRDEETDVFMRKNDNVIIQAMWAVGVLSNVYSETIHSTQFGRIKSHGWWWLHMYRIHKIPSNMLEIIEHNIKWLILILSQKSAYSP